MLFTHVPPARSVDGLLAVPIDIETVRAQVTLDARTRTAQATARVQFRMGPQAGCPIFDLRQPLTTATLDGSPIAPDQLRHRSLGGDPTARLRVLAQPLAAHSLHQLDLSYFIQTPDSTAARPIEWLSPPTAVRWDFYFSDLHPGRYLEMWLPANLIFDRFQLTLELQLQGTDTAHTLVSNGTQTSLGGGRFRIEYPANFTALSPMLHLAPSDSLESTSSTVTAASGPITFHTFKARTLSTNLSAVNAQLHTAFEQFVISTGSYNHGSEFHTVLWSESRAMEYDGATTSTLGALRHELFHSWYGRGVKPATQNDGWLDEAWTVYNTDTGAFASQPFDLDSPPVELCTQDPYRRATPNAAYTLGARFFAGLAAELGVGTLRALMRQFYSEQRGQTVTTQMLATFLIRETQRIDLADFFHRFVYGFAAPDGPARPDLYLRDNPDDSGAEPSTGPFWRSPDVWVRHTDDGGTTHQYPEYGQDNWFYARVRNRGTATADSFVVAFTVKTFNGTEFMYPRDFQPYFGVALEHRLAPGQTRIVRARWPASHVPSAGTHGCLLVTAYCPEDPPANGHVWEQNNLAQRNLTIVDVRPNDTVTIPVRFGSAAGAGGTVRLGLVRPAQYPQLAVELWHARPQRLAQALLARDPVRRPTLQTSALQADAPRGSTVVLEDPVHLTAGAAAAQRLTVKAEAGSQLLPPSSALAAPLPALPKGLSWLRRETEAGVPFPAGAVSGLPARLQAKRPLDAQLRLRVPDTVRPGQTLTLDVLQEDAQGRVTGGLTIELHALPRL